MTVTLLDSGQSPVGSPFVSSPYTLASTAPNPIPSFTTASADGRHREITFDMPLDNGAAIEYIVVRRMGGGSPYFYNVSCAVPSVACDSYVSVCYTTPPPCSIPGSTFSFTVGLDIFPTMGAYLTPMQSYEWSIIGAPIYHSHALTLSLGLPLCLFACLLFSCSPVLLLSHIFTERPASYRAGINARNAINGGCWNIGANGAGCDGQSYGAWSPSAPPVAQGSASPDRALPLTAAVASATSIHLSWDPAPFANGAPVLSYKTECSDASTYITATWQQPDVVQYTPPANGGSGLQEATMVGLTPGTTCVRSLAAIERARAAHALAFAAPPPVPALPPNPTKPLPTQTLPRSYRCFVAANNSAGGFAPVFNAYFTQTPVTLTTQPEPVDPSTASCTYTYDDITTGQGGGGPATLAPSMGLSVRWNAPRPNDGSRNDAPDAGPPKYNFTGELGKADFSALGSAVVQVNEAPHPPSVYYGYNAPYTFHMQPFNDAAPGYYGTAGSSFSCETPKFRPAAPIANIVNVFDREMVINWTEPNDHGDAINQYIYQICKVVAGNGGFDCDDSDFVPSNTQSSSWFNRFHMCGDGTTRIGNSQCQGAQGGMASANNPTGFTISEYRDGVSLLPKTEYAIVVRARNSGPGTTPQGPKIFGIGWASPILRFTTNDVPPTPTNDTYAPRSIKVSWVAYAPDSGTVTSYTVTIDTFDQAGAAVSNTQTTSDLFTTFYNLVPATQATFRVQATVFGRLSGYSDPAVFYTAPEAPDGVITPTTVMWTNKAVVTFHLPFPNGFPVDSFLVVRRTSSPFGSSSNLTVPITSNAISLSGSTVTYSLTGLTPAVVYTVEVAAGNFLGFGPTSPPAEALTCSSEPSKPTVPTFLNHTTSSISIQWTPPTANVPSSPPYDNGVAITEYRIWYRRADAPTSQYYYETHSTHLETSIVGDIEAGREYQFRVSAYNGENRNFGHDCTPGSSDGWSPYSDWSDAMTTQPEPPMAPYPATCDEPYGTVIVIQWNANFDNGANITSYTIYSNATAVPRIILATDVGYNGIFPTSLDSRFVDLVPNSPYSFVITANNSAGESPPSHEAIIYTDKFTPNVLLTSGFNPKPERSSQGDSITVSWGPPYTSAWKPPDAGPPHDNGMLITAYEIKFRCPTSSCPTSLADASATGSGLILANDICKHIYDPEGHPCTITSFEHKGLTPSTPYEYKVRSYNGYTLHGSDGWSAYTPDWVEFYTAESEPLVPPAPDVPTLYEANGTGAILGWHVQTSDEMPVQVTPPINRYSISYTRAGASTSQNIELLTGFVPGDPFNLTLSGLLPATQYYFAFSAGNINGLGTVTNRTFSTTAAAPGAPGAARMRTFSNASVALDVDAARPNGHAVTDYFVELCYLGTDVASADADAAVNESAACHLQAGQPAAVDGNGTETLTIGPGGIDPVVGVDWAAGTAYRVRTYAINALGEGGWSAPSAIHTAARPYTPSMPVRGSGVNGLEPYEAIQVVWSPPYNYGKPLLAYELSMDGLAPATLSSGQAAYVAAGIVPGSLHNFTVRAMNEYGWSEWSPTANLSAAPTVPSMNGPPTYTPGSSNASGSFLINVPAAEPNGYPVQTYEIEDANHTIVYSGAARTYQASFGGCTTQFLSVKYRARAYNALPDGSAWSAWSSPALDLCSGAHITRPGQPTGMALAAEGPHTLYASWAAGGDALPTGYQLVVEKAGGDHVHTIISIEGALNLSYTWHGAVSNTAYTARVMALNGNENSDYSDAAPTVTTATEPPSPPSPLPPTPPSPPATPPPLSKPTKPTDLAKGASISGLSNTTYVHLTWAPPASNGNLDILKYRLVVSTVATPQVTQTIYLPLVQLPGGPAPWSGSPASGYLIAQVCDSSTCVPLTPGASVDVQLSACNGFPRDDPSNVALHDGCGAEADTTLRTAPAAPGVPGPLSAEWHGDSMTIQIPPAAFDGGEAYTYQLEMNTYGPSAPTTPDLIDVTPQPPSGLTSYTRERDPAFTYVFKARAVNALGASPWTAEKKVMGVELDAPPPPEALTVSNVGQRSFEIAWRMPAAAAQLNGSAAIAKYRVLLTCDQAQCPANCLGGCPEVELDPPQDDCSTGCNALVSSDTAIRPFTRYKINLIATSAAGLRGDVSNLGTYNGNDFFTTLAGTPDPPVLLSPTGVNTTAFTARWLPAEPNGQPVTSYHLMLCCTATEVGPCTDRYTAPGLYADPTSTSQPFSGLDEGSNCSLTITATNDEGASLAGRMPSEIFTHAKPRVGLPPSRMSLFSGKTVLHIEWPPPFSFTLPILSYSLIVDGATQAEEIKATELTAGFNAQYLEVGLYPGTPHTFRVAARNALGLGEYSPASAAVIYTDSAVPGTPPKPTVDRTMLSSTSEFTIHRPPYAGLPSGFSALTYEIEEWQDGYYYASSNSTDPAPFNVTRNRLYEVNYKYRVRAFNTLGHGDWSDFAFIDNARSDYPPDPQNVTVTGTTRDSVSLSWALERTPKSEGAEFVVRATAIGPATPGDHYDVQQLVVPVDPHAAGPGGASPPCVNNAMFTLCSFTVSPPPPDGIKPDTIYTIEVAAVKSCSSGSGVSTSCSSGSVAQTATTPTAPPDAPSGLQVLSANASAIEFGWRVPHSRGRPVLGYVLMLTPTNAARRQLLDARRQLRDGAPPATSSGDVLLLLSPAGEVLSTEYPASGSAYDSDPGGACALLPTTRRQLSVGGSPGYDAGLPSVSVSGLPSGMGYAARVFACNTDGASAPSCLAPPDATLVGCNMTGGVPPHTQGVPAMPAPVTQDEAAYLQQLRIHTLFVTWAAPHDNELPITRMRLAVGNETWTFDASVTAYNVTGLPAATQFAANVQAENSMGWGEWSPTSWITTLPTRPAAPPRPRCDPLATTHDALSIQLDEARPSNGQPVEVYEVRVLLKGRCAADDCSVEANRPLGSADDAAVSADISSGALPQIYFGSRGPAISARNFLLSNASVFNYSHSEFNVTSSTEYAVLTRAYNALGWSAWSEPSCAQCDDACTTPNMPDPPLNPLFIIIPLGGLLVVVVFFFFLYWFTNLSKILAPKMRRKRDRGDPLNEFVSSDMTPMEEQDPELVINPIFIHKIKMDKERQRKQKSKKGLGLGKTGGLARLNLRIDDHQPVVDERVKDISAVDHYLERERGVHDASKQMTAYEKHQAGKALLKGAKKAQDRSVLAAQAGKQTGVTNARDAARAAARLGDDDGQQMSCLGGSSTIHSNKGHTAAL